MGIEQVTAYKCPITGKLFLDKGEAERSLRSRKAAETRAKKEKEMEKRRLSLLEAFPKTVDSFETAVKQLEELATTCKMLKNSDLKIEIQKRNGLVSNKYLSGRVTISYRGMDKVHRWDIEHEVVRGLWGVVRTGSDSNVSALAEDRNGFSLTLDLYIKAFPLLNKKFEEYLESQEERQAFDSVKLSIQEEGRRFSISVPEVQRLTQLHQYYNDLSLKCKELIHSISNHHHTEYVNRCVIPPAPQIIHEDIFSPNDNF